MLICILLYWVFSATSFLFCAWLMSFGILFWLFCWSVLTCGKLFWVLLGIREYSSSGSFCWLRGVSVFWIGVVRMWPFGCRRIVWYQSCCNTQVPITLSYFYATYPDRCAFPSQFQFSLTEVVFLVDLSQSCRGTICHSHTFGVFQ